MIELSALVMEQHGPIRQSAFVEYQILNKYYNQVYRNLIKLLAGLDGLTPLSVVATGVKGVKDSGMDIFHLVDGKLAKEGGDEVSVLDTGRRIKGQVFDNVKDQVFDSLGKVSALGGRMLENAANDDSYKLKMAMLREDPPACHVQLPPPSSDSSQFPKHASEVSGGQTWVLEPRLPRIGARFNNDTALSVFSRCRRTTLWRAYPWAFTCFARVCGAGSRASSRNLSRA